MRTMQLFWGQFLPDTGRQQIKGSRQTWSEYKTNIYSQTFQQALLHYDITTHAQLFPTQQYWQQCMHTSESPSDVLQTTAARLPKQSPYSLCSSSLTVSSEH